MVGAALPSTQRCSYSEPITVEFAGFEVTRDSVRHSQKYLTAIRSFPTPYDITDIRSWFGLVNQVAYTFSMTERMSPFRSLLRPGTPFQWDDTLQKLFEESKTVILDEICKGVKIVDKTKPTCLVTDWSKDGIGFWLLQKHCDCQTTPPANHSAAIRVYQIVMVGSRFSHSAESRYRGRGPGRGRRIRQDAIFCAVLQRHDSRR